MSNKGTNGSRKILLVDKNTERIFNLARELWSKGNYEVGSAGNYLDAVRVIQRNRYDLVIADAETVIDPVTFGVAIRKAMGNYKFGADQTQPVTLLALTNHHPRYEARMKEMDASSPEFQLITLSVPHPDQLGYLLDKTFGGAHA